MSGVGQMIFFLVLPIFESIKNSLYNIRYSLFPVVSSNSFTIPDNLKQTIRKEPFLQIDDLYNEKRILIFLIKI